MLEKKEKLYPKYGLDLLLEAVAYSILVRKLVLRIGG